MARGQTRDLYLQVSGDIRGLKAATQAGKTVLADFSGTAVNVLDQIEKEMAKLGSTGLPNLKTVEQAYGVSMRRIRDNAKAVLDAPTPAAAVQIIDAEATRSAAVAAQQEASALRLVAEAAARADQATGGTDAATRAYATAAATAAINAEREADALRAQAAVLGTVERQLGVNAGALKRGSAISGEARAGYQQLSFQLGDVATQYASGTAASIIFAQQIGQVTQAVSLITRETKGFLGIIGGPWGVGLGAAAVVLTPWVAKLLEGNDALEKEKQQLQENAGKTAMAREAKAAFARTEAGLIEDVRALTDEIDRQNASLKTNAERQNIRAKNRIEGIQTNQATNARELAAAQATLRTVEAQVAERAAAPGALGAARAEVARLTTEKQQLEQYLAKAQAARLATQKDLAGEAAQRANDPMARIKRRYDQQVEDAKRVATAEETVNGVLTRRLAIIDKNRKNAEKTEQERQSAATRSGRAADRGDLTPAAVGSILKDAFGGTITSTTGGKHVRGSYHYRRQAVDFVPSGGMTGTSKAQVRATLEAAGVPIKELLGPGDKDHNDHFHVAFGKTRRDAEQIAARAQTRQNKAEAAAEEAERNAQLYQDQLRQAGDAELRQRRARATTIEDLAAIDVEMVDRQRDALKEQVQRGVTEKRWTQAEADAVAAIIDRNAAAEAAGIEEEKRLAIARRRLEIDQADLDDRASLLRLQQDLASTAADRRRIARQLLAIEQQSATAAKDRQIAEARDPERRAQLVRERDQLPVEYALRGEQLDRSDADPMQRYGQQLLDATSDMDEALKEVAADGFGALEDASSRAAASAVGDLLKIRGVAGDVVGGIIADLARLAIQKAMVAAIGGSLFGTTSFNGGVLAAGTSSALESWGRRNPPAFARGGLISGPGTATSDSILALVGGREPILVSNGEGIVNAQAVREYWPIIDAMNKGRFPRFADGGLVAPASFVPRLPNIAAAQRALAGGQGTTIVHHHRWSVNAQGAVLASDLMTEMRTMSETAVIAGAQLAQQQAAERAEMMLS